MLVFAGKLLFSCGCIGFERDDGYSVRKTDTVTTIDRHVRKLVIGFTTDDYSYLRRGVGVKALTLDNLAQLTAGFAQDLPEIPTRLPTH
jgi:hypothetical protein